jgi:regulator of sigma E protease
MSWVLVLLGFSLLVLLHEGGHFVAAKATGMRVERFFLFFGPTLFSFRRGETEYGVKLIPLGGFAKISGMNPEEELSLGIEDRAYYRQSVWKRIVVVGAGPAVNIALAFVIFFVLALTSASTGTEVVHEVVKGSPAAGVLKPGDKIVAVDGRHYPVLTSGERIERFRKEIGSHECAGKQRDGCLAATPVTLAVLRGSDLKQIRVKPKYDAAAGQPLVGFSFGSKAISLGIGEAVDRATGSVWMITSGTFHVISHLFESTQRKQISSVVGISDVAHQTTEKSLVESLVLLAVVSLSLGLINLLPILPLDGGHIFWSLVEKLRGKPASLRVMERATVIGFALVAVLMFIGLSNDIGRLTGEGFNVR